MRIQQKKKILQLQFEEENVSSFDVHAKADLGLSIKVGYFNVTPTAVADPVGGRAAHASS